MRHITQLSMPFSWTGFFSFFLFLPIIFLLSLELSQGVALSLLSFLQISLGFFFIQLIKKHGETELKILGFPADENMS